MRYCPPQRRSCPFDEDEDVDRVASFASKRDGGEILFWSFGESQEYTDVTSGVTM